MKKDEPILIGFVCNSCEEENQCWDITDRYFAPLGYRVVRRDVLMPARATQMFASQALGLPHPGNLYDPTKFKTDPQFMEYFLELYEINLAGCLRSAVRTLCNSFTGKKIVVVTTDIRNKVLATAESMGYRIIRIEAPQPRLYRGKSESHLVEGDYQIPQKDFPEKGMGRVVRAALRAILKKRVKTTI